MKPAADAKVVPDRLILWDIDGTLVTTGGAGIAAMCDAGKELFGPAFSAEGIDFSGRLDTLIMPDMLRRIGVVPTAQNLATLRARYASRLPTELQARIDRARALPGVKELLAALRADYRVAQGLVTGNFAETGTIKLRACGIDTDHFVHNGWGDAAGLGEEGAAPPTRDQLPPVAIASFEQTHQTRLNPVRGVVIGDTPHDVRCGRASGCRTLAVATGKSTVQELAACGAHLALPDLSDVDRVLDFLLDDAAI